MPIGFVYVIVGQSVESELEKLETLGSDIVT